MSAVLMLGTSRFADPGPPLSPAVATMSDVRRLSEDSAGWHQGEVGIDGQRVPTSIADISWCRVGFAYHQGALVTFVCTGIEPDEVQIRSVSAAGGYRLDPTEPHSFAELEQEWRDFFHERPDLEPDGRGPQT